ncbi:MAG TPA: serine hydrolase [Acidimicrobiia bacterium]
MLAVAVLVVVVWALAIGTVAVWRVITHGTTTVWDHLEYPGRDLSPSPDPRPWVVAATPMTLPVVEISGETMPLESILAERDTLSFLVVSDGEIVYEWYAPDHGRETPSMLFSVSKSVFSLMVGAAVHDGLLNTEDPLSTWVPELGERGFTDTIPNLLTMRSGSSYVENDNPFGVHVEFNYTDELEGDILGLAADGPRVFRYKSGDYAVVSLALKRALGTRTLTDYLTAALWNPLGAEDDGKWSTDHEDGLERVWCCLAMTARELARFGQLVVNGGEWGGEQLISPEWIAASLEPAVPEDEWAAYADSAFDNYGYGWWLTESAAVGFGKDGQYLYVDPDRRVVVVRLGDSQGGIGWVEILARVAEMAAG